MTQKCKIKQDECLHVGEAEYVYDNMSVIVPFCYYINKRINKMRICPIREEITVDHQETTM